MQQQTSKTIRKVKAATVGAPVGAGLAWAATIFVVWLASLAGIIVPDQVQVALEIIFAFGGSAAGAWISGYYTAPIEDDIPVKAG